MESSIPQVLYKMLFSSSRITCSSLYYFAGSSTCWPEDSITTANRQKTHAWYCCCPLIIMYKHTEKWWVAWSLSSFEENRCEVFFFSEQLYTKGKRYTQHISVHRDTHWVFSMWHVSSYIERDTQNKCLHSLTPSHISTPLHTASEYECGECPWAFTGVCMLPDDEIPDLYYSWEDSRREWQFWSTLEWHNHVNTCILKTSELIWSF